MYSQSLEEQIILNYFGPTVGTFCSVGENDGVTFSNVRALAERSWKGVCIEPDERAFQRLKKLYEGYRGIYCYDYAICNFNGKRILQQSGALINGKDAGLVSTFHVEEMARFSKVLDYTPKEVKCFTWKTALNRWKIKRFDLISLDVEGSELEILPSIDLSETKMLVIEWNSKPHLKTEYEKYLEGFKLIYTSGENLIYAR